MPGQGLITLIMIVDGGMTVKRLLVPANLPSAVPRLAGSAELILLSIVMARPDQAAITAHPHAIGRKMGC